MLGQIRGLLGNTHAQSYNLLPHTHATEHVQRGGWQFESLFVVFLSNLQARQTSTVALINAFLTWKLRGIVWSKSTQVSVLVEQRVRGGEVRGGSAHFL